MTGCLTSTAHFLKKADLCTRFFAPWMGSREKLIQHCVDFTHLVGGGRAGEARVCRVRVLGVRMVHGSRWGWGEYVVACPPALRDSFVTSRR